MAIPADARVFASVAWANRDKAQFPEPARFAITRATNRPFACGHGIHFCIRSAIGTYGGNDRLADDVEAIT